MIKPKFNPTNAPESEVHARGRYALADDWLPNEEPLRIFRLEERERVINGLGITASSIVTCGNLGAMGLYDPRLHLLSRHESRGSSPFVSFGSSVLVRQLVQDHEWGIDPVVVEAEIGARRSLVHPLISEVLLVGGLSPDEFIAAHEVDDFIDGLENSSIPTKRT